MRTLHILRSIALLSLVAAGCNNTGRGADPSSEHEVAQSSPLYNAAGSTSVPAVNNSRTGVGRLRLDDRTCVGTLIHDRFIVASATKCALFPAAYNNSAITLTTTSGVETTFDIDRVWLQQGVGAIGSYRSEIALMRTTSTIPSTYVPATIAATAVNDGSAVSSFGYGAFGATSCASTADGKKRGINWTLDGGPYRVCNPGDWGAPIFAGNLPGGDLVATILHPGGLGNVLRYREAIYDQMLQLYETGTYLPDSRREGQTLVTASPLDLSGCQLACLDNTACKAWNFSGTTCTLLSDAGRWVPSATTSSGLRPVVEYGINRGSGTVTAKLSVGAAGCAASCALDSGCQAWRFHPLGTSDPERQSGSCFTYALGGPRTDNPGNYAGQRSLRPSGIELVGGTYSSINNVPTPGTCAAQCGVEAQCVAYTYYNDSRICELKNVIPASSVKSTAVSDFKRPFSLPNHGLNGQLIDSEYVANPALPETCQADCEANSSCVAYSTRGPYFGNGQTCLLYSSVDDSYWDGSQNSGFKGLTFQ